jgi:hypothetical protein
MRYIDQDKIYSATDSGLKIFEHYFPNVDLKASKTFFKEREDEKTASAHVSWHDNFWRITDFGNPEVNGLTGVAYIMYREKLSFYEALVFIEDIILNHRIEAGNFKPIKWAPEYSFREMTPQDKKGKYNWIFKRSHLLKILPPLEDTLMKKCFHISTVAVLTNTSTAGYLRS